MSKKPETPTHSRNTSHDISSKYEKALPQSIQDFMVQYIAWQEGTQHPDWKQEILMRLQGELQGLIKAHWKESSKTRLRFGTMTPEQIWEDEANGIMRLTKRNLTTLDPNFLPKLDQHILSLFSEKMDAIRAEGKAIVEATYARGDEISEIEARFAGIKPDDYSFDNYGNHLSLQAKLRAEFLAKFHVIEFLRQREMFCQHLVEWEQKHKTLSQTTAKGKQDMLNWTGKFRVDASNILLAANEKATQLIKEYEEKQKMDFTLNGQKYMKLYLDRQKAQVALVKTNFSQMTADILFFGTLTGDGQASPVVGRLLEPILEPLVSQGPPLTPPPKMPVFADEVGFAFRYE